AAEKQFEEDGKQIEAYLKENNIAAEKTESNLYYNITETTDNEKPQAGDSVVVHYVGKLLNGKVFDSSYSRGEPYEFVLGKGMVIKGWDIGIGLLRKGEKATLYIPSPLGYGPMAQGDLIPANAILVFDVELVDF
ncbi:MAG: FKBP-type peptidyl-prolyl cis-trans isomerase, partial [Bacteroidota bacterium]